MRTLALHMVANPELRCSRHAEDSRYALPSRNDGGDPVAPSCGLILEGPQDGERYLSKATMPVAAPTRAE